MYGLDINGDINLSAGNTYRINGTPIGGALWIASGTNVYTTGHVGIGTIPSAFNLDVYGNVHASGSSYGIEIGNVADFTGSPNYAGTAFPANGTYRTYQIWAFNGVYYSPTVQQINVNDDGSNGATTNDPSSLNVNENSNGSTSFNSGDNVAYTVWAYRNIHGQIIVDSLPTSNSTNISNTGDEVDLTWTGASGADGYIVQQDWNTTYQWVDVGNVLAMNDYGTTNNVAGYNSGTNPNLTTTAVVNYQNDLSWTATPTATSYTIYNFTDNTWTTTASNSIADDGTWTSGGFSTPTPLSPTINASFISDGDVYFPNVSNGVVLQDTVTGLLYRLQVTSGAVVATPI